MKYHGTIVVDHNDPPEETIDQINRLLKDFGLEFVPEDDNDISDTMCFELVKK